MITLLLKRHWATPVDPSFAGMILTTIHQNHRFFYAFDPEADFGKFSRKSVNLLIPTTTVACIDRE